MYSVEHIKYLRQKAIALNFSFPANFKRYSSKRLVSIYNGIGAEWMPEFLRKITSFIFDRLEAAALLHDFEYTRQKKSYWHFTVANLRFAYNAAKSRQLLAGVAGALLCQLFGWRAYKTGKEDFKDGTS